MGEKICNSNLPSIFQAAWKKKRSVFEKAAAVSASPSAVASGASGCDWPASAERASDTSRSTSCTAAGDCGEKENSWLIIPPKCGAAGDAATRSLRNHSGCQLDSFCSFLSLGGFLCQRKNGDVPSSETLDFLLNCVFDSLIYFI